MPLCAPGRSSTAPTRKHWNNTSLHPPAPSRISWEPSWVQTKIRNETQNNIMKNSILAVTFLALTAFAVGCNKDQTPSEQLDTVKAETKQAAQDIKDYTFAQKAEFVAKMQSQLAEINTNLDQLDARIEKSSDSVKAECAPKLQVLRDQQSALSKQLDQVKDATESTWDSVKAGTSKAYASLKEGFQQSRQWVSDKIAP